MHDDDDPPDEIGKLIHSGIRREEDVEPAEYALPPGVPALQDPQLEDDDRHRPLASRRRVMILALAGATLVTGSFLTGRMLSQPEAGDRGTRDRSGKRLTQEELKLVHAAQAWADAPIEVLVGSDTAFLWVFQLVEPDEKLLKGLRRLTEYAILDGGEKGYLTAVRILKNFEYVEAPAELDPYRADLQEVIWRWQMKQDLRPR